MCSVGRNRVGSTMWSNNSTNGFLFKRPEMRCPVLRASLQTETMTESHKWPKQREQVTSRCLAPIDTSTAPLPHLRLRDHCGRRGRKMWEPVSQGPHGRLGPLAMKRKLHLWNRHHTAAWVRPEWWQCRWGSPCSEEVTNQWVTSGGKKNVSSPGMSHGLVI